MYGIQFSKVYDLERHHYSYGSLHTKKHLNNRFLCDTSCVTGTVPVEMFYESELFTSCVNDSYCI